VSAEDARHMISCLNRQLAITVLCALLGTAGCGSYGQYVWVHQRPIEPASAGARNLIGPGDLLEVQVYGDEKMSIRGRVLADGTLTVPLLGPVQVVGKRPEDLSATLEEQLKRYITVPKVTVIIQESLISVAVIGEVKQAGMIELVTPATVLQALAKAGGMTEYADSSGIFVLRNTGSATQRIRFKYSALTQAEPAAIRFQLKTGDVLVVE
jgi:polysaccharide biosynthesis/export protein